MSEQPIELEAEPQTGVTVYEQQQQVQRSALTIDELHEQLAFIRQVMAREMKEGQDYGKIPGCGDKPGLFQPGAQKLLLVFQLTPHVKKEVLRELPHPTIYGHREYEFTITVRSKTGREWDGVGTCSTLETKYRYRGGARKCPDCGKETIIKGKKEYGGGWLCFTKKGGCGHKWPDGAEVIESQSVDKVENDNPAEYWNTVRKMGFKRAQVHAAINATNTSELWSQDLEDLPNAGTVDDEIDPLVRATPAPTTRQHTQQATTPQPQPKSAPEAKPSAPAPASGPVVGPKWRMTLLHRLLAAPGEANRGVVTHFLMSRGWITGEQPPEEWPIFTLPKSKEEFEKLQGEIQDFERQMREQPAVEEPA